MLEYDDRRKDYPAIVRHFAAVIAITFLAAGFAAAQDTGTSR